MRFPATTGFVVVKVIGKYSFDLDLMRGRVRVAIVMVPMVIDVYVDDVVRNAEIKPSLFDQATAILAGGRLPLIYGRKEFVMCIAVELETALDSNGQ